MEFSVLTAGVHTLRQLGQKLLVKVPSGKRCVEHFGINAGDDRLETRVDESPGQFDRIAFPYGEEARESDAGEFVLAVFPEVIEEDIPKRDARDALRHKRIEGGAHATLVFIER